jgi:uncharacterized membrane protein
VIDVSATTTIDAPLSEVFAYMDRPENQVEITPSLTRSERLAELDNGGKRVAYTYTMAGVDLDGEIEAVEYEPESRIRWEMSGDLAGEITWAFAETDEGTRVTYASAYELPVPVIDRLAEPFVERYNERELRTTLENLRTRLETAEP